MDDKTMLECLHALVICPGCGEDVPANNWRCDACGYEHGYMDGGFLSVAEIMQAPSYPAANNLSLNEVSPKFIARIVRAAAEIGKGMGVGE